MTSLAPGETCETCGHHEMTPEEVTAEIERLDAKAKRMKAASEARKNYACMACGEPLIASGLCEQCSRAWAMGRCDALDHSWVKITRYADDPKRSWEERFRALETHHEVETRYLIAMVNRMRGILDSAPTHRCGYCGLEKNENAPPGSLLPGCTVRSLHAWDRLTAEEEDTPLGCLKWLEKATTGPWSGDPARDHRVAMIRRALERDARKVTR